MLAYLDALLAALAARDTSEIDRLLAHPLVRILSSEALADATAERRAAGIGAPPVTPLNLLQLRYRTAQLLGDRVVTEPRDVAPAAEPESPSAARRRHTPQGPAWADRRASWRQMELPLPV